MTRANHPTLCLLCLLLLTAAAASPTVNSGNATAPPKTSNRPAAARPEGRRRALLDETYARLPLAFEPSPAKDGAPAGFVSRGRGYNLTLAPTEVALSRTGDAGRRRAAPPLRMRLEGADPSARAEALGRLPGASNYLIGRDPSKWRTGVPQYARVRYDGVYPGIDAIYYGNGRRLEYDFVLAPGADPRDITLRFEGARSVRVERGGDLVLLTGAGEVRQLKPVIYQEVGGVRKEVPGRYVFKGARRIGFSVGAYDRERPLVIDPVLTYSVYLGGSNADSGNAIAVDEEGNAYVAGHTASLDFPTTPGAFQTSMRPLEGTSIYYSDAFVTKINPQGTAVLYSTYVGGSTTGDGGNGIDVDDEGNAYVVGVTGGGATSSGYAADFPLVNPWNPTFEGSDSAFIFKLNPTGSALVYSTYIG
ncbi:MAG TPA: SBBP repeat-containing protein, partial [Pyrinomonadaceae bacterium]|nr:SBBP repeat-containing protein [Pyrinomonadaceae bacterium]